MNERIHGHLDGDLSLEDLTQDERSQLEAYETVIRHATAFRGAETFPEVTKAVMGRIAHREPGPPPIVSRIWDRVGELAAWLWRPHAVRLRPAYGFGGAAAFLWLLMAAPSDTPTVAVTPGATESQIHVFVQFRLDAPAASTVRLAGSFTGWEPAYALQEGAPGVWSILVPLVPGVHEYSFVVDDLEWRPDPVAPRVDDGFGGENSRVAVVLPSYQSL